MNFNDTFLDKNHLLSSFPNYEIILHDNNPKGMLPPYRLVITISICIYLKKIFKLIQNLSFYVLVFIFKKLLIQIEKL